MPKRLYVCVLRTRHDTKVESQSHRRFLTKYYLNRLSPVLGLFRRRRRRRRLSLRGSSAARSDDTREFQDVPSRVVDVLEPIRMQDCQMSTTIRICFAKRLVIAAFYPSLSLPIRNAAHQKSKVKKIKK
jgi:hypothetical protein